MSQSQQYKKVKLYRNLKVVFYMLGLPLFLLAVFFTAVRFLGHDPFMGTTEFTTDLGFFKQIESYITAPALYGVWIGFGVWAFVTIVHVILSKTVKNDRARMFAVLAVCMVAMLGTGLVLDVVCESKVADLQAQYAGTSVTIDDYKTQLSYYRTVSSNASAKSYSTKLMEQIALLENVYNVKMEGMNKSGTAGNIANKPVTYYNVIWENPETGEVEQGVDICYERNAETGLYELAFEDKSTNTLKGDGDLASILDHSYRVNSSSVYADESSVYDYRKSPEYKTEITLAPNANGELVINGRTYTHYWCKTRSTSTKGTIYVWYCKDLMPVGTEYADDGSSEVTIQSDGIWGRGVYNSNGLLGDGWVYSLENVLAILEDYYSAQEEINANKAYADKYDYIYSEAVLARHNYYSGILADPEGNYASKFEQQLYKNEIDFTERFSLTSNGLDYLVAKLGAMLGDNGLFDFLLRIQEFDDGSTTTGLDEILGGFGVGSILEPILNKLATGMDFAEFGLDDAGMATALEWVGALTGCSASDLSGITKLYLVVAYNNKACPLYEGDGMYVAIVADRGGSIGTDPAHINEGGDVFVDLVLDDSLIDVDADGNIDYDFDLDHLNTFLNTALNGLMDKFSLSLEGLITGEGSDTMATIGGLIGPNSTIGGLLNLIKTFNIDGETYYGFEISGMKLPLINEHYEFDIDIKSIIFDLIGSMYYYQSPCIKPVWEFYTWNCGEMDLGSGKTMQDAAIAYREFQRAEYQAVTWGTTIGSTLIGDNLGTGAYPSTLGLTNLASVQQLIADLSYKPSLYPIYGVRDMLFFFTGVVILFYYLSFVCAQKEEDYATGNLVAKEKKHSKKASDKVKKDGDETAPEGDDTPKGDDVLPADQNNKGGAVK